MTGLSVPTALTSPPTEAVYFHAANSRLAKEVGFAWSVSGAYCRRSGVVERCPCGSLVGPVVQGAYAAGGGDGCNPGRTDNYLHFYFAQAQDTPGSPDGGVQADIYNYSPWVAKSDYGVTGWVGLGDSTTGSYAQIGWEEQPGSKRYTFVQFNDVPGGHFWNNLDASYPINSTHDYKTLYDPNGNSGGKSGKYFTFWVDGSYITGSQYNWTPNFDQSGTEIHTQASQIPGGSSNKELFSSMQYYYGGWKSGPQSVYSRDGGTSGSGQSAGPSWDNVQAVTNGFNSWDSACTN